MESPRVLDHLVFAVPNLAAAIEAFHDRLGVRAILGGQHPNRGTHNALISLTEGAYFELIAPDPTNKSVPPPRWMGVDVLTKPQLTRWAVKSNALEHDVETLRPLRPELAEVQGGERQTPEGKQLAWQLTVPQAAPEVELIPFFIDWSKSEQHPADALPDMGCEVLRIFGQHPAPQTIRPLLESLNVALELEKAPSVSLHATLRCPNGEVTL